MPDAPRFLPALAALAALAAAGCYTDPATGRLVFGRRPAGPTAQELADQRRDAQIASLTAQLTHVQNEVGEVGTSVNDVALRSADLSQATEARGQDVVALRSELAALRQRVATLEGQLAKVPSAISTAVASEHQSIVSDVNKAIAASDAKTEKAIRQAVQQAARSGGGSTGGGRASSSGPTGSGNYYEYVVKSGDSLSAIASAFGSSVSEIMRENNIKDASKIRVDQVLYIPAK